MSLTAKLELLYVLKQIKAAIYLHQPLLKLLLSFLTPLRLHDLAEAVTAASSWISDRQVRVTRNVTLGYGHNEQADARGCKPSWKNCFAKVSRNTALTLLSVGEAKRIQILGNLVWSNTNDPCGDNNWVFIKLGSQSHLTIQNVNIECNHCGFGGTCNLNLAAVEIDDDTYEQILPLIRQHRLQTRQKTIVSNGAPDLQNHRLTKEEMVFVWNLLYGHRFPMERQLHVRLESSLLRNIKDSVLFLTQTGNRIC